MKYKSWEPRKREILEKAYSLFLEEGYDNVSIAKLAKASNMAKGLIYYYFDSKEAILVSVIEALCEIHAYNLMENVASDSLSFFDKFLYLLDAYHEIHPNNDSTIQTHWVKEQSFIDLFYRTFLLKIDTFLSLLARESVQNEEGINNNSKYELVTLLEGITGLTRVQTVNRAVVITILEHRFNLPKDSLKESGNNILKHFEE